MFPLNEFSHPVDDPFPDPEGLVVPDAAPTRAPDNSTRIAEDEDPLATLPEEEAEQERRKKAAQASALTLEMVGDLPFANVRPPENVLFVCKLNPVTRDEDLELIFSRFGTIMSCQVIRDKRTGDSLQYAFIEFDKREEAEQVCVCNLRVHTFLTSLLGVLQDAERFGRRPKDMGRLVRSSFFRVSSPFTDTLEFFSSQSVARLNNKWSNDVAMGPRGARKAGGFAGREDLEETRRYREGGHRERGGYDMVFDVPNDRPRRKRSRSKSPRRDREKERRRSPRRDTERDDYRDRDRRRSSRDRSERERHRR